MFRGDAECIAAGKDPVDVLFFWTDDNPNNYDTGYLNDKPNLTLVREKTTTNHYGGQIKEATRV